MSQQHRSTCTGGRTTRSGIRPRHRDQQGLAGGSAGSSRGAHTRAGPGVSTFSFLKHELKVTQHPGLSRLGGGHDQHEPPQEPGPPRQRPQFRKTPAAPVGQRPSEPQPGSPTAFNAELEKTARRNSPQCQWSSWC